MCGMFCYFADMHQSPCYLPKRKVNQRYKQREMKQPPERYKTAVCTCLFSFFLVSFVFFVLKFLCMLLRISYNINQQNAPFLNYFFLIFTMSSTCFEPEGSSSGRRLYVQVWYNLFTCWNYNKRHLWDILRIKYLNVLKFQHVNKLYHTCRYNSLI